MARAAIRNCRLSQAEVGEAYLEIDQQRDNVFIEMGMDVPDSMLVEAGYTPGVRILKVTKCSYGLRESGLAFYKELRRVIMTGEWVPSEIDPCVCVKANEKGEKSTSRRLWMTC